MLKYFLEIKNRIFLILLTWLSTLFICYLYKETLLFLLIQPNKFTKINNLVISYFIFTNVTEILSVYIQLITFLSFQFLFIYLIYHCFIFLNLAMFKIEFYHLKTLLKFSIFIWMCSIILINFLIVPITWNFFLSFQDTISSKFVQLHFEAKLNEYLNFYILIYYVCIFYCQIFTILFFFLHCVDNKINIIKKFRKLFYYFFVIFSTCISPPDVFSQVFISGIVIIIYELLIFGILLKIKFN